MNIQCPGCMRINELLPQHLQLVSQPLELVPAPLELIPEPLDLHAYLRNTSGAKWMVKIWRVEKTHSRSSSCLANSITEPLVSSEEAFVSSKNPGDTAKHSQAPGTLSQESGQLGVGRARSQASRW